MEAQQGQDSVKRFLEIKTFVLMILTWQSWQNKTENNYCMAFKKRA